MEQPKRLRKANFSERETLNFIEEISHYKGILLGKMSPSNTMKKKNEVWDTICLRLNSMYGNNRARDDLKKKWKDLKAVAIGFKSHMRGTGGGPPLKDNPYIEAVLNILGEDSAIKNGITVDGTDSCYFDNLGFSDDLGLTVNIPKFEVVVECDPATESVPDMATSTPYHDPVYVDLPGPEISQIGVNNDISPCAASEVKEQKPSRKRKPCPGEEELLRIQWMQTEMEKNKSQTVKNYAKVELIEIKKQYFLAMMRKLNVD